jgi:glycosyltransferase involved in cell wall biosynthesis
MKILNIFNNYLEPGGEAVAVKGICDSLSRVVDLRSCEFSSADWTGPDAPAVWKQALWMIHNPKSIKRIKQFQSSFQPNAWLVHNIFPVGSAAIYPEAKRLGVPIIQYIHNFRPFSVNGYLWACNRVALGGLCKNYWEEIRCAAWQNSRIKTAWLAFVLLLGHQRGWWRSVGAWIAISDFMREKFISAGVPAEKIFTLRHFWRPKPDSSPSNGKYYLFLGRLTEAKGINVLLDAWEILERRDGVSTPDLLIGGDGPLKTAVASRAGQMRHVKYAGQLAEEDKNRALNEARAVIVPSVCWEALGLAAYEAYDHSRSVLAARSGGLSEIVVEDETGLLHEPGNAQQLADQVKELETDRSRIQEMGRAGRRWLEQNAGEAEWQRGFRAIAERAINKR